MATVLIQDGAFSGAMAALAAARSNKSSFTPTDYSKIASEALAIAQEVVTQNAALTVPMADADNAQIGGLIQAVTFAQLGGRSAHSIVAADYAQLAKQICAMAKEAVPNLV